MSDFLFGSSVLREKDDAYDFKMAFKPRLFDASFKALTIDDVLDILPNDPPITVEKHLAKSNLQLPFEKNIDDTMSIIEFYLNKRWLEIPETTQREVFEFIRNKNGTLKTTGLYRSDSKTIAILFYPQTS